MIFQTGSIHSAPLDQTIPPALEYDPKMKALARATAKLLQAQAGMIRDTVGIYYRVDELSENVLDMLATDLHVDWYDYSYSLDIKRSLIKDAVKVHRTLGTRAAVDTTLYAIFGDSFEIEEWFEYEGEPYTFRVEVNISERGLGPEEHEAAMRSILLTKNVRSWLEGIYYKADYQPAQLYTGAWAASAQHIDVWPEVTVEIDALADTYTGGTQKSRHRLQVWPSPGSIEATATERAGGPGAVSRQRIEIY